MSIVYKEPYIRFEKEYHGIITVLEGAELSSLLSRFFWHFRREMKKCNDFGEALFLSVLRAYQNFYSIDILDEAILKDLRDPDARKVDLFYQGMIFCFTSLMYPEVDWEKEWGIKGAVLSRLNKMIQLKPNLLGIGVDFNSIIEFLLSKKNL